MPGRLCTQVPWTAHTRRWRGCWHCSRVLPTRYCRQTAASSDNGSTPSRKRAKGVDLSAHKGPWRSFRALRLWGGELHRAKKHTRQLQRRWDDMLGKWAYSYFNWRQVGHVQAWSRNRARLQYPRFQEETPACRAPGPTFSSSFGSTPFSSWQGQLSRYEEIPAAGGIECGVLALKF